jgi:hypothetical protein
VRKLSRMEDIPPPFPSILGNLLGKEYQRSVWAVAPGDPLKEATSNATSASRSERSMSLSYLGKPP